MNKELAQKTEKAQSNFQKGNDIIGNFPFDKNNKQNALDNDSFLNKWMQGIRDITPFQQARITYFNTYIMVFGILAGVIISFIGWEKLWWLGVILLAALFNTIIIQVSNYQKYHALKKIEEMKGGFDE